MYDNKKYLASNLFMVEKANKKGIITQDDNFIIEFGKYDHIIYESIYKLFIVNIGGELIYEHYIKGGHTGLMNGNGIEIVPLNRYDSFDEFFKNKCSVYKEGKYGLIDISGVEILPCVFDSKINNFKDGLAIVKKNGLHGLINDQGDEILPCKFENINSFIDGRAKASLEKKIGLINSTGQILIEFGNYDNINIMADTKIAIVTKNNLQGLVDLISMKLITPICYGKIDEFNDGIARIYNESKIGMNGTISGYFLKKGVINEEGCEIVPLGKYGYIGVFYEGCAKVKSGSTYGMIDKYGKEILPVDYNDVWNMRDGLAEVQNYKGQWGLVDNTGNEIIPIIFDGIKRNFEQIFWVRKNKKIGIRDSKGNEIIPLIYDDFFDFSFGFKVNVAVVGKAQQLNEYKLIMKYGLINFKGEEITEFKYDFIDEFSYDVAIVKMDGKFGLINFKGVEITPIIYDSISTIKFKSGAKAVLNGNEGWITLDGHFLNEKPPYKKT